MSKALSTDFISNFDLGLVLVITITALVTKIGGVLLGARFARMPIDRDTWGIAWGLNARGATGSIRASVGRSPQLVEDA